MTFKLLKSQSVITFLMSLLIYAPLALNTGCKSAGNDQIDSGTFGLKISKIQGDNQNGVPNYLYPVPLTVQVHNVDDVAISGIEVEFFEKTDVGVLIPKDLVESDLNGYAMADVRAPRVINAQAVVVARIKGTDIQEEFNLSAEINTEGNKLVLVTTNNSEETAGVPFNVQLQVQNDFGEVAINVNGAIETNWYFQTSESWTGRAATGIFSSYTCTFVSGVCYIPAPITLMDATEDTIVSVGDGEGGFTDLANHVIKVSHGEGTELTIANKLGGPANNAQYLGPHPTDHIKINTDSTGYNFVAVSVDLGGNWIEDLTDATWLSDKPDMIEAYADPDSSIRFRFVPTKYIPRLDDPNFATVTVSKTGFVPADTRKIYISAGAPKKIKIVPRVGDENRLAGVPMEFDFMVTDANDNLVGRSGIETGVTGQYHIMMEFQDYASGDPVSGGTVPRYWNPGQIEDQVRTPTKFLSNVYFYDGRTYGSSTKPITFWDGTDVEPKVKVTLIDPQGNFTTFETINEFNVSVGPPKHIMLRNGLGGSAGTYCPGFWTGEQYMNVEKNIDGTASGACNNLAPLVAGVPKTFYAAVEDQGGNFIANVPVSWGTDGVEMTPSEITPQGAGESVIVQVNSINNHAKPIGRVTAAATYLGTPLSSSFNIVSAPGTPVKYYVQAFEERPGTEYTGTKIEAPESFYLNITRADEYNNCAGSSVDSNVDLKISLDAPLLDSPDGVAAITPDTSGAYQSVAFSAPVSEAPACETKIVGLKAPNILNSNIEISVEDPSTFSGEMNLIIVPGPAKSLKLLNLGGGSGEDKTDQSFSIASDSSYSLYASVFDDVGNFAGNPALTNWSQSSSPMDLFTFATPTNGIVLDPNAVSGTSVITAQYTDPFEGLLEASTGTITVVQGDFKKFQIVTPATVVAGIPFNITVKMLDSNDIQLNYNGDVNVTFVPWGTASNATNGYNYTFPENGNYTFTNGERVFPVTFFNAKDHAAGHPQIYVSGYPIGGVQGTGTSAQVDVKPGAFDTFQAYAANNQVDVGQNARLVVNAVDSYYNRITEGDGSQYKVKFEILDLLAGADFVSTDLSSHTGYSGTETTIEGDLNSGRGQVYLTSNTKGSMDIKLTSIETAVTKTMTVNWNALTTIQDFRWRVSNPPPATHTASVSSAINPLEVEFVDSMGNVMDSIHGGGHTVTLSLNSGDPSFLSGTTTVDAEYGRVTFNDITYSRPGAIEIKMTYNADPSKTVTHSLTVNAGAPKYAVVALPNQTRDVNAQNLGEVISGTAFAGASKMAGDTVDATIYILDEAFNLVDYDFPSLPVESTDPYMQVVTGSPSIVDGIGNITVRMRQQGNHTIKAKSLSGSIIYPDSSSFTVTPQASPSQYIVLLNSQSLREGAMSAGAATQGSAPSIAPGDTVNVKVVAVDDYYNKVSTYSESNLAIAYSDSYGTQSGETNMSGAEASYTVSSNLAGTHFVNVVGALSNNQSDGILLNAGTATQIVTILDGQTFVPGAADINGAVTGTPNDFKAGENVTVTLKAVDSGFNVITSYAGGFTLATPNDSLDDDPGALNFQNGSKQVTLRPIQLGSSKSLTVTSTEASPLTVNAPDTYNVILGDPSYIVPLIGSQTLSPAKDLATARSGTAIDQAAGQSFSVKLVATDKAYNILTDRTDMVFLNANGGASVVSDVEAGKNLVAGEATFAVTNYNVYSGVSLTASGVGTSVNTDTYDVVPGAATKLLVKLPNQTYNPGKKTIGEVITGSPLKQTVSYAYMVDVYLTDDHGNQVSQNDSVSLGASTGSLIGGGAVALSGGHTQFTVANNSSSPGMTLSATGGGFTSITSTAFEVLPDFTVPSLSLDDTVSGSTTQTSSTTVDAVITSGASVVSYCLSESQSTNPSPGTGSKGTCSGGTGGDAGWLSTKPTSFLLSSGDAVKTVYLWVADQAGNVYDGGTVSHSITLDTNILVSPTVALEGQDTLSSVSTNNGQINITVTNDDEAVAYCVFEEAAANAGDTAATNSAPLWNDACWGTEPTSRALATSGYRRIEVFVKDAAANVQPAPGTAVILNNAATNLLVELETVSDKTAGVVFNLTVTARRADNSTDTSFDGSKSLMITSTASNGANTCGAVSLAPELQSGSHTFTSGVATVSNVKLKKVESGVTISAAYTGLTSGTTSAFNVVAGPQHCVRVVDAQGSGGNRVTAISLSSQQKKTYYASNYDEFGNYIEDTDVNWSLSGAMSGYEYPEGSSNSVDLYGTRQGSFTLTTSPVSENVSVSVGAGDRVWNSSSADQAGNNRISNNSIHDTFIWETSSDETSDWRTNSGLSWYSEAAAVNDRSSRSSFPPKAILIASNGGLDIMDLTSSELFMRFTVGAGTALDSALGVPRTVVARNGKIFVGMHDGSSAGGMIIIDLNSDSIYRITSSSREKFSGDVANRESGTWSGTTDHPQMTTGAMVYDLSLARVSAKDHLLIGTDAGVNVYNVTDGTSYQDSSVASAVQAVFLTDGGEAYYNETGTALYRADLSLPLAANFTSAVTYNRSSSPGLPTTTLNEISVIVDTSSVDGSKNAVSLATDNGLVLLHEHATQSSGELRTLTYQGTDVASNSSGGTLTVDGSSAYASASSVGSVGAYSAIELTFRPDIALNSASATGVMLMHGDQSTNGSYGFIFNKDGDGKVEFFTYFGGTRYSVKSSQTSWAKGQWYHVAAAINGAFGIHLWVDGGNKQSNGADHNSFASVSLDLKVGGDGTNSVPMTYDWVTVTNAPKYFYTSPTITVTEPVVDGSTIHHFGFSETEGLSAANSGTDGTALTLSNNALITKPHLNYMTDKIHSVQTKRISGQNVSVLATESSVSRVNNTQNLVPSAAVNMKNGAEFIGIDIFHIDGTTSFDFIAPRSTGGFTLKNL